MLRSVTTAAFVLVLPHLAQAQLPADAVMLYKVKIPEKQKSMDVVLLLAPSAGRLMPKKQKRRYFAVTIYTSYTPATGSLLRRSVPCRRA